MTGWSHLEILLFFLLSLGAGTHGCVCPVKLLTPSMLFLFRLSHVIYRVMPQAEYYLKGEVY